MPEHKHKGEHKAEHAAEGHATHAHEHAGHAYSTHEHTHTKSAEKAGAKQGYSVRGATFSGVVVSAKAPKTVTVQRILTKYVRKYERYKKIKSKVKAHNPEWINAMEGDTVTIGETRKISKTKSFVVTSVLKRAGQ